MLKILLVILSSSLLFSKVSIEIEETEKEINVKINNLNELGSGISSVYEHPPVSSDSLFGLSLPFAIKYEDHDITFVDNNFEIKAFNKGEYKGIEQTLFTIFPTSSTYPDSLEFQISLKKDYPLGAKNRIPVRLRKLLNREQLSYQLDNPRLNKSKNNKLQNSFQSWMKDGVDYLKIGTNKVGISKIPGSELITYFGNNNSIENLHLLRNGEDYKHFYIQSDDDVFSENDNLYLITSHQYGDSTFYDHHTDWAYFYLYFDENKESQKLTLQNSPLPNNQDNYIIQEYRHEVESEYSFGASPWEIGTNNYEGWYEKVVAPFNNRSGELSVYLDLFLAEENLVQVTNFYSNNYFLIGPGAPWKNVFSLDFHLNNSIVSSTGEYTVNANSQIPEFWKQVYDYRTADHNFLNGPNKFTLESKFIREEDASRVGVDFFTVRQAGIAIARDGIAHVEKIRPNKSYSNIHNFKSPEVVAIDTANGFINFAPTAKSNVIYAGIESKYAGLKMDDFSFSVDINDDNLGQLHYIARDLNSIDYRSGSISTISELDQVLESDFLALAIDKNIAENLLALVNSKFNVGLSTNDRNIVLSAPNNDTKVFSSSSRATGNLISKTSDSDRYYASVILENSESEAFVVDSDNFTDYSLRGIKNKTNSLYNTNNDEVLVIYHKDLSTYVESWKEYRENQGFSIRTANVEDIFDEFSFGRKSPHSIREYLRYAKETWGKESLEYVYLVGDASWDPKYLLDNSVSLDQIPVYGRPYSDMWYAMLDTNSARRFDVSVTRLSAHTNEEAMNYLDKVKEFESLPPRQWFKEFLLLVGGYDNERNAILSWNNDVFEGITKSDLRIDTTLYIKESSGAVGAQEDNTVLKEINSGVMWTNFMGHGAFNAVDIGGWEPNKLTNAKRTGVLSTVSCNNGAFAEPSAHRSRNEDQLLVPEKGFVGVFGGTATGNVSSNSIIMMRLFEFFENPQFALRRLSDILYLSLDDFEPNTSLDIYTLTYNYLGDPLLELPYAEEEDYLFLEETKEIISSDGSNIVDVEDEFAKFSVNIFNLGYHFTNPEIIAIHTYNQISDTIEIGRFDDLEFNKIEMEIPTKEKPGNHLIQIMIDPNRNSQDENFDNNLFSSSFEVFDKNLIPFDPLQNWNLSGTNKIRFFNSFFDKNVSVEASILDENGLPVTNDIEIFKDNNIIDINNLNLDQNKYYKIKYRSKLENDWSAFNEINFNTFISSDNNINYDLLQNNNQDNYLNMSRKEDFIYFDTTFRDFKIESLNGFETTHAGANFDIDGDNILQFFGDGYLIATFSRYEKEETPKIAHFNTLGWFYPPDKPAYYIDSLNFKLVDYLRDSIADNDYIMLATAGNSARQFEIYCNDNICHKDTLVEAIKEIGIDGFAKDNIDIELGMAYFGGIEINPELKKTDITRRVLAQVEGSAPIFNLNGEISSEIIGPSRKWNHLEIESNGLANIKVLILDINNNILDTINTQNNFVDLENYDNEFLKFKVLFSRNNEKQFFKLNKLFVNFEPIPEIGLVDIFSEQDSILRGDIFEYNYTIKNYSLRSNLANPELSLSVNNELNNIDTLQNLLPADNFISKQMQLDTRSLFEENQLVLQSISESDIFEFNNSESLNFKLMEDKISPEIHLVVDGEVAEDGQFISKSSDLYIELYDNSRLTIEDFNNFQMLRFNGFLNENELELENNFNHDETGGLKARFKLPNDRIQFGDNRANLVQIIASDASNNLDSLLIYLNVSEKGRIFNQINYPNPFFGNTTFKFDLIAPEITENTEAQIQIYDTYGNSIRTLNSKVQVGENEITWDGLDANGNSIPSGRYYYVIMIKSDYYFPPTDAGISIKVK